MLKRFFCLAIISWACVRPAVADDAKDCASSDLDLKISACSRIITAKPAVSAERRARAFTSRAWAYNARGEYNRAIADLNEAIRLNPNLADAFDHRGWANNGRGEYDLAISDLNEAIRLNPKLASAYDNRAWANVGKGNYDQALADWDEAIRTNPKYYHAHNNRGWLLAGRAEFDRAIADFTEAISIRPTLTSAFRRRGAAYAAKGEGKLAIADFSEALRLNPNSQTAYNERAAVYIQLKDYDRAISDADASLRLDANQPITLKTRGYAHYQKGAHDLAIEDLTGAIRLGAGFVEAYLWRAAAYSAKGLKVEATADYRAIMRLPDIEAIDPRAYAFAHDKLAAIATVEPPPRRGEFGYFKGEVVAKFLPDGLNMRLEQPFSYVDPKGQDWDVPAGTETDGASVPRVLWTLFAPFSGNYRGPAVIHDHYCRTKARPWKETHLAFYNAMRAADVSEQTAKIMYGAVYHFGPRWGAGAQTRGPGGNLADDKQDAAFKELRDWITKENPALDDISRRLDAAPAISSQKPVAAGGRWAFVVGINKYDHLPDHAQLTKAVGDANAVGTALTQVGFKVTTLVNPGRSEFNARWQDFLNSVRPDDTAAVVFSGHGVEINGANYLLPRDAPRVRQGRDQLLMRESLSLHEILADLREKRTAFNFVVIDACRDNPFGDPGRTVGAQRGLAKVDPPFGSFIMFSAGAYQKALDRLADDDKVATSVYTRLLLPLLSRRGLNLLDMADRLSEEVRDLAASVSHSQTPAFYSGVPGARRICLAGCDAPQLPPAPPQEAWVQICRDAAAITSPAVLRVLADKYKGSSAERCIQARLEELRARLPELADANDGLTRVRSPEPPPPPRPSSRPEITASIPAGPSFAATRAPKVLTSAEERTIKLAVPFKECATCPEMLVAPPGEFLMGAPDDADKPQQRVVFAKPFAASQFHVTRDEFQTFVKRTKHDLSDTCRVWTSDGWTDKKGKSYLDPGYKQDGRHPVVCVDWEDAKAYADWLSKETGKPYRLLTEAEREYIGRAGTQTAFWWGGTISTKQANYDGTRSFPSGAKTEGDSRRATVDVRSFAPNPWSFFQVHGNVWEWTQDCYDEKHHGGTAEGRPWLRGDCTRRILRGGSFDEPPKRLLAHSRTRDTSDSSNSDYGFRVGREMTVLDPAQVQDLRAQAAALRGDQR